ncbi:MAG: conditioned medium factor [Acidobacteriota bacterium]|nr:conditioned medium factor [Acidobacteriota bacterium]
MQISKQLRFYFLLCLLVTLVVSASAQKRAASSNQYKQLGGAAEEISAMRLPNPSEAGIRSKAAMIPFYAGDDGREIEIPVDSAKEFKLLLLAPNASGWKIEAALPGEDFVNLREGGSFMQKIERTQTDFGTAGEGRFPAEVFRFGAAREGILRVRLDLPDSLATNGEKPLGYLVASNESPYRLYSYIDTFETLVGREIGLVASLFDKKSNAETGLPDSLTGGIRRSTVSIQTPSGEIVRLEMSDEGNGSLRAAFTPQTAGKYLAQVITAGTTPDGREFLRTAEHSFEVAAENLKINDAAKARLIDDLRWQIDLPVNNLKIGRKIIAHGEVWSNGQPIAWLGGMTEGKGFDKRRAWISLALDSRWLSRAGASGNYELRNVRLQDANNAVVLAKAEKISLPSVYIPDSARNFNGEITDEMRQGARPEIQINDAVGGKLMLVHGYCSGDAWGAAASAGQFTDYVKFLDLNRNRTHDQFANLIRNFGASLPSFGIVAHSQGGAASLHLYTYYWSGLDYATGGTRLIQSVGTPYQGTALAGNLALLGQIFGAGCGANNDLTYSGAAAWLANIPSWARAKVYYHTTSFTDVWYRYDYCSLATDPFLSDPEDGVVERAYAQLTGANNLGHKTGWCHTGGMRDPSQTTDAARNANMNANAAR